MNSAADVVEYSKSKSMFREVNMSKYLAATTTRRRQFYHATAAEIESQANTKLFHSMLYYLRLTAEMSSGGPLALKPYKKPALL